MIFFILDSNATSSSAKKRTHKSQNVQIEDALNMQKNTHVLLETIFDEIDELLQVNKQANDLQVKQANMQKENNILLMKLIQQNDKMLKHFEKLQKNEE